MARAPKTDAQYIAAAQRMYNRDGEIEVDGNAVVSRGDDPGAYVQAWVWVYAADIRKEDSNGPV